MLYHITDTDKVKASICMGGFEPFEVLGENKLQGVRNAETGEVIACDYMHFEGITRDNKALFSQKEGKIWYAIDISGACKILSDKETYNAIFR